MAVVIQPGQHTYNGHLLVLLYIWCVYPGTDGEVCNPHQVQNMLYMVHFLCFSENQFEVIVILIFGFTLPPAGLVIARKDKTITAAAD